MIVKFSNATAFYFVNVGVGVGVGAWRWLAIEFYYMTDCRSSASHIVEIHQLGFDGCCRENHGKK